MQERQLRRQLNYVASASDGLNVQRQPVTDVKLAVADMSRDTIRRSI